MKYSLYEYTHTYKGVTSTLTILPGTCNVFFSSDVVAPMAERGKGLGKEAHRSRLIALAFHHQCRTVFCFVQRDNIPQIRILSRAGWETVDDSVGQEDMLLCKIDPVKYCEDNQIGYNEKIAAIQACEWKSLMYKITE